nr:terminase [Actinomycetospora corticicola]
MLVPPADPEPWPTLGPQVCDLIEARCVFGPGSLKGQPAVLADEVRALIYRAYELHPRSSPRAGRRRFSRFGYSARKGSAKTEVLAWLAFAELHAEGPVRFAGWDAAGQPVGRPVTDPYIPLLAYAREQVEELAFGALFLMVTEGPDADLFDAGLERIQRLDARGRADGKAVPLSGSPNARDGARTTFQGFDEPHRLTLPSHRDAHETMLANIPKRPLEQPWSAYVTTAGQPGQHSIAEDLHGEAQAIAGGDVARPRLFYFHREAGLDNDLSTHEGRVAAVAEASAPHVAAFSDLDEIAEQWERPGADLQYLERVWLNRWTQAAAQAFSPGRFADLIRPGYRIPPGSLVTAGFDGARFRDAAGLVLTEVSTGHQQLWWRAEERGQLEGYEVDPGEATEALAAAMERFTVWRLYGDPPHFVETMGEWAGRWPDQVEEWWTNRRRPMAEAVRAYREAIEAAQLSHDGDADFARHVGNAGKRLTNLRDEDTGEWLWILGKLHPDRKFDFAMAAVLSWRARLDALRQGATVPDETFVPVRIR